MESQNFTDRPKDNLMYNYFFEKIEETQSRNMDSDRDKESIINEDDVSELTNR